jgi:iron complex transport system permease protein
MSTRVVRLGPASAVLRPRAVAVALSCAMAAVVAAAVAVSVGDSVVPLPDVVPALLGTGDPGAQLVVRELRLPRVVVGLVVGTAFGLAGALTQSVLRNPLASPDVVGVTAGASAGAVCVLVLGAPIPLSLAALLGGLVTAALVALAAWQGGVDGPRLVLVGIALAACATAVTTYALVQAETADAQRAVVWLTGSLNGRSHDQAAPVLLALAVALPALLVLGRGLGALSLGDDVARALGVRVGLVRGGLLLVAVVLAAVATASAGPIAFVALVAPQVALRLARTPAPPLLGSAAVGALLVVVADAVARTALSVDVPVGAVTGVLGAPVLLVLLRRATS